jgi:hypothetical protein
MHYAASNGLLNVIKWARQNKYSWDELTCSHAARGHLKVLQWVHENVLGI